MKSFALVLLAALFMAGCSFRGWDPPNYTQADPNIMESANMANSGSNANSV